MIEELENVVLNIDLPEAGLRSGDVGSVVLIHRDGEAYEVEFVTLEGRTVAVVTLTNSQIRNTKTGG